MLPKKMKKCTPSLGFNHCFEASVFMKATPEKSWGYLSNIVGLSEFFPSLEFKRGNEGPLLAGEIYYSKLSREKKWTGYKILVVEEGRRLSAKQIGRYKIIEKMKYDHRLIPTEGGTLSQEKVEYTLSFGFFGKILNFLFVGLILKKLNLLAHQKLKEKSEEN